MKRPANGRPSPSAFDLHQEGVEQIVVKVNIQKPIEVCCHQHYRHIEQP